MQMSEKLQHSKPNGMADAEWAARLELAAAEVAAITGDLAAADQVRMHSVGIDLVS